MWPPYSMPRAAQGKRRRAECSRKRLSGSSRWNWDRELSFCTSRRTTFSSRMPTGASAGFCLIFVARPRRRLLACSQTVQSQLLPLHRNWMWNPFYLQFLLRHSSEGDPNRLPENSGMKSSIVADFLLHPRKLVHVTKRAPFGHDEIAVLVNRPAMR